MKKISWLLLASTLFLTACSSEAESVQSEVQSAYATKEELVVSLNEIQTKEAQIQADFDEAIAADEELVNFKDGSASVFANIESREEALESVQSAVTSLQEEAEKLQGFEGETLPIEAIHAFAATINEINSIVTDYAASYEEQLEQEKQIFESFGSEEADFDTLYDGVETLNGTSDANLSQIQPLIDLLAAFDTQETELVSELTALQEQ